MHGPLFKMVFSEQTPSLEFRSARIEFRAAECVSLTEVTALIQNTTQHPKQIL